MPEQRLRRTVPCARLPAASASFAGRVSLVAPGPGRKLVDCTSNGPPHAVQTTVAVRSCPHVVNTVGGPSGDCQRSPQATIASLIGISS